MKVLVNGGLNLFELDGWWAEAYSPGVGWAIEDGQEHGNDPRWDAQEANALYSLLEREIIPEFYARDDSGIPRGWVARIKESMSRLTPLFSANRAVRQYVEQYYLAAVSAYRERIAKHGVLGSDLADWQARLAQRWAHLRFGSTMVEQKDGQYSFQVQVFLDGLDPDAVSVEVYADAKDGHNLTREPATRAEQPVSSAGGFNYTARIPATRPVAEYTSRLVPRHAGAIVPL
jgi:starch phosphorylase